MNQSKLSTFIVIYCIIAILSVWQTHRFSYNWQLQTLQTESSDQLLSTVSGIRQALDKFRYLPFLLTQNPNIHQLTIQSDEATSQNVSLFLEQTNLVAGSTALFILSKAGRTLAYSHWRDQQDFFERNHNDQPYFLNAENEAQTRVFSMLIDGKAAFFMSAPIYHTGALTGVAVVRIDLSLLEPKLPQDRLYDIRDSANRILFTHTNKKLIENNFNWQPSVLDNGTRIQIGHSEHGPKYTRQAVTLDDLKWSITVYNNTLPVRRNARGLHFMLRRKNLLNCAASR